MAPRSVTTIVPMRRRTPFLAMLLCVPMFPAQDDTAEGCCFSIGYGSMMKPCCLKTWHVRSLSECPVAQLLGGATSYTSGACPATPAAAETILNGKGVIIPGFLPVRGAVVEEETAARQGGRFAELALRVAAAALIVAAGAVAIVANRRRSARIADGGATTGPLLEEGS
mmetsp:Transcript_120075/g.346873  ORF Transcript_120075/g.346873 Transcript_120075/m.346873 type:complete len:169 (+) Transcript_120075:83-589(+)